MSSDRIQIIEVPRAVLPLSTALFITLLVLQLTEVISISWVWVTAPLWVPLALWVLVFLGAVIWIFVHALWQEHKIRKARRQ